MSVKEKVKGWLDNIVGEIGIKLFLSIIAKWLTVENIKSALDALFDSIENAVEKSETKWDDATVLPLINKLRKALDIPDGD